MGGSLALYEGSQRRLTNLGGVGGEHVKLVHRQTQFAQVDVEVHHHVAGHGRREHFLKGGKVWRNVLPLRCSGLYFTFSISMRDISH